MNKKIIAATAILILVTIILALTRPNEPSFKEWSKEKYAISRNSKDNNVMVFLKNWTHLQIIQSEKYQNKILFATVKANVFGKETTYLGILGNWYVIARK
jgi:hypothetical protein